MDSLLTEEDVEDGDDDDDDDGFVELIPVGKDGAMTYRTTALDRTTLYRLKSRVFTVLPVDKYTLFPRDEGYIRYLGAK